MFRRFVIMILCSASLVATQAAEFDQKKEGSKKAVESGKKFEMKGSGDASGTLKTFETKSATFKSFDGLKQADNIKSFDTGKELKNTRIQAFDKGSKSFETKSADSKFSTTSSFQDKTDRDASKSDKDNEKKFATKEYRGPEAEKVKEKLQNVYKPNLTPEEVRELLNSPGTRRKEVE